MSAAPRQFVVDANVLIDAHRKYYAFDICPGFWTSLVAGHAVKRIFSIGRVRTELTAGGDALAAWTKAELPDGFFLDDTEAAVVAAYTPMMKWVASGAFLPAAVAKFASDADGWLIAAAKHGNFCVVTQEAKQAGAKARVPMPNVCEDLPSANARPSKCCANWGVTTNESAALSSP